METNLKALPKAEIKDAMLYYEQYFYEGHLSDGQAVAEFGTPKNLARRLVADYYMDEARDIPEENQKSPLGLAKIITLALLASPILIPVAITVVALIFAIVVTFAALAFSIVVTLGALGFAAVLGIVGGIFILTQSLLGGLFYISAGISVIGGLILLCPAVTAMVKG
ncbi:hypothetical protein RU88_GL002068 [Lactococcus raffinolactis]|nr:hypothetical protein RU88_GL002068 [Lactococcus raffinolactis]